MPTSKVLSKKTKIIMGSYPVKYSESTPMQKKFRPIRNILISEAREGSEDTTDSNCNIPVKHTELELR